jgi:RNA polymerase sigma-70 factor (ECF subfamily)
MRDPGDRAADAGPAQQAADMAAVAGARDRDAFSRLFLHFAPRIKAYMMRQGLPAQRAEDLAQETMILVWRKAGLFDPARAAVATWVFAIARNARIDAARRETHPECPIEEAADVADAADPADALADRERRGERLREAIAGLPPEQAEVIRLSFFADKAHGAIAAELGLPLGTVKSRIRLAVGRIREALGEEG